MLLTNDFKKNWEAIVEEVDKQHIPITFVKKVVFRTRDKRQKTVNLKRLRAQGADEDMVEAMVEQFIQDNEQDISSMEFILDIDAVAGEIQPATDQLLKELK